MNTILIKKILYKLTGKISLKTKVVKNGDALISYITSPFLNDKSLDRHTNVWECKEMARILLDMGYDVDIIDWDNNKFIPKKRYSIFIDIFSNLERLSPYLEKTKKIFHITGAHWQYMNHAEYSRLLSTKSRRGIALKPNRTVTPTLHIEYADYCTGLGNQFTFDTYKYANKHIERRPISSSHTYNSPKDKDFENVRKNYVWIGGSGMIHKGLDLILEAFAKMPDYHLTIIGPVQKEKDFVQAYHKELYDTPNIKLVGWLDLGGKEFEEIIKNTLGIVYASCSEGGGGSVILAMHAGLIPIISKESSVDTYDFGITLPDSSVEEITKSIATLSSLPTEHLREKAIATWNHARKTHTREKFSEAYSAFLKKIHTNK